MAKMDGGSQRRAAMRGGITYKPRGMAQVTRATNAMPAGTQDIMKKGRSMADVTKATPAKPC